MHNGNQNNEVNKNVWLCMCYSIKNANAKHVREHTDKIEKKKEEKEKKNK